MPKLSANSNLIPLLLSGGFAIFNIAIFFAVTRLTYGVFFSFGYFFLVIYISGIGFPLGLIGYRAFEAKWAWWSVALACVISVTVSAMHSLLIAAAAAVV